MKAKPAPGYRIEALKPVHERATFSCGDVFLDQYISEQAGQDARRKVAATFVLVAEGSNTVIGYYTLSANIINLGELPASLTKKLPKYPTMPATLIGRFAVSEKHKNHGLGKILLLDALSRSLIHSSEIASMAVIVDAMNNETVGFYLHYGFIPFEDRPTRLFLQMSTIKELFSDCD